MPEEFIKQPHNSLLSSLSVDAFSEIATSLKIISLKSGEVLFHQGEEVSQIYFPHSGAISIVSVIDDGRHVETASVGFEGAFGLMSGIGYHASRAKSVVQLPLIASKISSVTYRRAVKNNSSLFNLALAANDAFLDQIQVVSGCHALHTIAERLASWILQADDRMHGSDLCQTQEMLSGILGVTRSAVSEVAAKLQTLGLIQYSRGLIKVTNRSALAHVACECRN